MELVLASISNNEGSGPTGDSMIGLCGWDGGIYLETRNSSRLDKPKITKIDLLVETGDLHSIGRLMTSGPIWSCFYPTSCRFHSLASKNDIIFGYCRGAWEESPTPLSHGPLPGDNPPQKNKPCVCRRSTESRSPWRGSLLNGSWGAVLQNGATRNGMLLWYNLDGIMSTPDKIQTMVYFH